MKKLRFTAHDHGSHLHVVITGERTQANVSRALDNLVRGMQQDHASRLLIDIRAMIGLLGPFEIMEIVTQDFPRIHPLGITKIAVVDRQVPSSGEAFMETVARNRGFNLRVFDQLEDAQRWLSEGSKGPPSTV